ncbi:pyridoxamine 5'-phosphate oxidase [Porphyromonadaceae bacterium W3.11]|nr:pyridoxamine 5'-phosphate oxidase [Porphyromonadaceae bacterium W3.11]
MDLNLEDIRREFKVGSLSRSEMPDNPIEKMEEWLQDALNYNVIEPTAIVVTTATKDGHPSSRTLLCKEIDNGKVIFYTNYESRKGTQISENPYVSVTFLWHQLERQIHVEGICEKLPPEESDAYFAKRSYTSRVGARISPQSRPIPNRTFIVTEFAKESLKYTGTFRKVPRPDSWGGYQVTPNRIEFWQGRESRLHDRFLYELQEDGSWSLQRIAP